MHEIDPLLKRANAVLKKGSASSVTAAGPTTPAAGRRRAPAGADDADRGRLDEALVDAINQLFSEFAFAYHNQFHKAFPDQASIAIAKEYWLSCLQEFPPAQITRAARRLVKSSEYLPNLSAVVKACQNSHELYGLPSARDAYLEACRAPSPKAAQDWSHAAVYHAGRASDWFILATEPESVAFPIFEYNYSQICERVIQGQDIHIDPPPALTRDHGKQLTPEERKARMRKLRKELGL